MDEEGKVDEVLAFFLAGQETVAHTMTFALSHVSTHRQLYQNLQRIQHCQLLKKVKIQNQYFEKKILTFFSLILSILFQKKRCKNIFFNIFFQKCFLKN